MNIFKTFSIVFSLIIVLFTDVNSQQSQIIDARKKTPNLNSQNSEKQNNIRLEKPKFDNDFSLFNSLMLRHSERELSKDELTNQQISNILWAANGLNRGGKGRTVPSAMGSYMVDIYAFTANGIYLWIPEKHNMELVEMGDFRKFCGEQDFVNEAPLNLIFVANFEKYYKHVKNEDTPIEKLSIWAAIEAGHISQNVYLASASMELGAVIRVSFKDQELFKLLKLSDKSQIIAAQTIGSPVK